MENFIYDDGGRGKYFRGSAGDCAVRALAIFFNDDYKNAYDSFNPLCVVGGSPRDGSDPQKIFDVFSKRDLVHVDLYAELDIDILSNFDIIIQYDNHMHTCKHGKIHDTHQKREPYEAEAIWCRKCDEEAIMEILWG